MKWKLVWGNVKLLFVFVVLFLLLMDFKLVKVLREFGFRVYDFYFVNMDFNLEYLFCNVNMEEFLFNVLLDKCKGRGVVSKIKKDGWGICIDFFWLLVLEEIGLVFKKCLEWNVFVLLLECEV